MVEVTDPAEIRLPRIRALDGLRGVAVAAVMFFHDDRLRGGYLGVDLFFVLSGFLITSLLLAEFDREGRIRFRHFYERRARRLLPALGLALVIVALYSAVWAREAELSRIRWDGIATLLYVQNWREILTKQTYFDAFTAPSALQHAWSLSIEEQFYAIWPLIVVGVLAVRRSARAVLGVALVLAAACAIFTVVAAYRDVDQRILYFSTATRAPGLLMGAALAAAVSIRGPIATRRGRMVLELVAATGMAYLAWAWTHQSGDVVSLYRGPLLLCGLAGVAVIAAAAHPERGPIARVFALKPLVALGLISYGLYLFHWPVFLVLTPARTGWSGWALFAERVLVSVAIAVVSYLLIERPIRLGALRRTRAFVALGTATAIVATSLVVTTHVTQSPTAVATANTPSIHWPMPVAPQVPEFVQAFLAEGDYSRMTNQCSVNHPPPPVRKMGPAPGPKVLLLGDSVACFLGATFDMDDVQQGVVTLNRGQLGCLLASPQRQRTSDGASWPVRPACIQGQQQAIAAFHPDVAVLMVGAPETDESDLGNGNWVAPCDAAFDSWYAAGARRSIDALSVTGATVVVVTLVHAPHLVDIPERGLTEAKGYNRDVGCENQALRTAVASEPTARLLDLDAYLCPKGQCTVKLDGLVLRADGVHFEGEATRVIENWMLPRVLRLAGLHAHPPPRR